MGSKQQSCSSWPHVPAQRSSKAKQSPAIAVQQHLGSWKCWHCRTFVQTLAQGEEPKVFFTGKEKRGKKEKARIQRESLGIHLWKTDRGLLQSAWHRKGEDPAFDVRKFHLQLKSRGRLGGCVRGHGMKAVSKRKMERMSGGERGTLWAGRKVHMKEMRYSKSGSGPTKSSSRCWKARGKKTPGNQGVFPLPVCF